jgi:DNA-binding NtrC family response regulator
MSSSSSVATATLLIVDDLKPARSALRRILRGVPVDIHEAESGIEALNWLARQTTVAAVIADFDMGDGPTGLELLERVQAQFPGAACFLHTGTRILTVEVWTDAWLVILAKPVDPERLRRLIAKAVAG